MGWAMLEDMLWCLGASAIWSFVSAGNVDQTILSCFLWKILPMLYCKVSCANIANSLFSHCCGLVSCGV